MSTALNQLCALPGHIKGLFGQMGRKIKGKNVALDLFSKFNHQGTMKPAPKFIPNGRSFQGPRAARVVREPHS